MSKTVDRIRSLENLLKERDIALKKKIRSSLTIYAVLVSLVAAYTLWIVPKLQELTEPDDMFQIVKSTLSEHLTTLRTRAITEIKNNSEVWVTGLVAQTVSAIPQMEKPALRVVDELINYVTQHIEDALIPAFTTALSENAGDLKERYSDFRDQEKMQGLALIFVEIFETEMDKYFNERFVAEVNRLQSQLREYGKPKANLTKKEAAKRQVLIGWVYLAEHNQGFGTTAFNDYIERMKNDAKVILKLDEPAGDDEHKDDDELEGVGMSITEEL